jgi:hypothetical protein
VSECDGILVMITNQFFILIFEKLCEGTFWYSFSFFHATHDTKCYLLVIHSLATILHNRTECFIACFLARPFSIHPWHRKSSQLNHFPPSPSNCNFVPETIHIVWKYVFGMVALIWMNAPCINIDSEQRGWKMNGLRANIMGTK